MKEIVDEQKEEVVEKSKEVVNEPEQIANDKEQIDNDKPVTVIDEAPVSEAKPEEKEAPKKEEVAVVTQESNNKRGGVWSWIAMFSVVVLIALVSGICGLSAYYKKQVIFLNN